MGVYLVLAVICLMFGTTVGERFELRHEDGRGLDLFTGLILDKIGISLISKDEQLLECLLNKFPDDFPITDVFSTFARSLVPEVHPQDGADAAITAWMDCEEKAFRLLEHHFVQQRLTKGIDTVEDFVKYSLSVQNRRKSRAGHALENHLRFLFTSLGIRHDYNVRTENKVRPDFLFPGLEEYNDPSFPEMSLSMLGAKTTCKDRWRQVLSEATRIPRKHLLTLEPSITADQTQEMDDKNLQLVVPRQIFHSYTAQQQSWLMDVDDFVKLVRERQS